jgi:type I restriction enzyme, S subunit
VIADLKPYPQYKDSGSSWLARVPRHWEVRNLRTLIRVRNGRGRSDLPLLSVARERGVFVRSLTDADENHNVIPEDLTNYKVARTGDLVINKMKAWQGSMGIAPSDGIVSPAYFVFDFNIANREYGQALLRSKPYVAHFAQASDGVRVGQWDLTIAGMRQIPVLAPPREEQAAIVRFLDWANGRLERAIRAKRKVIALLNEQKQAVIYRAITRGLDPAVPFKSSGIAWLGDIPRHWEVRRLKWVLRLQRGFDLPADRRRSGSVPVFSSGGHIDNHSVARASAPGIVIGRYGSTDAVFFVTALFTTTFYDNCARWCFFLLRSLAKGAYAGKSAVPGVDRKDLFDIGVPRPPVNEQSAIAAAIDGQLAVFDRSIAFVFKEIELLREYRSRLVADVVTGKFDVREAAARLPDNFALEAAEDDIDLDDETENADEMAAV